MNEVIEAGLIGSSIIVGIVIVVFIINKLVEIHARSRILQIIINALLGVLLIIVFIVVSIILGSLFQYSK